MQREAFSTNQQILIGIHLQDLVIPFPGAVPVAAIMAPPPPPWTREMISESASAGPRAITGPIIRQPPVPIVPDAIVQRPNQYPAKVPPCLPVKDAPPVQPRGSVGRVTVPTVGEFPALQSICPASPHEFYRQFFKAHLGVATVWNSRSLFRADPEVSSSSQ